MARFIDISVPLSPVLPAWPDGYGYQKHQLMGMNQGDVCNVSRIDLDVHSGTHIDAPLHFIHEGEPTSEISLEILVGPCYVADFGECDVITAEAIRDASWPSGISRILFKTPNSSNGWFKKSFDKDFVALSNCAAELLFEKNIRLVGIDGPSIQKFYDSADTHITLLKNKIVILEGLNLENVDQGFYHLTCLPISIENCEGAPARAVLEKRL